MTTRLIYIIISLFFLAIIPLQAQEKASLGGTITDVQQNPLELVNIAVIGLPGGSITNRHGVFSMEVPAMQILQISISSIGFKTEVFEIYLQPGERKEIRKMLQASTTDLPDFVVSDTRIRRSTLTPIDPKSAAVIPSPGGGIESLIKTLPGVSSSNELSSQYSVRGGNYDENLVYVNDVEIYRPFLVRSGQQEGLSFLNPDLTGSILFSAGGFEASYGDKMSSVLDIRYKKPTQFGGSFSISLLGASLALEGVAGDKVSFLFGVRQKSNQFLLENLQTTGDYKPSFTDIQGWIGYQLTKDLEISFLGNYSRNLYRLIPETRETDFGTINEAYRFTVYFDGQEADKYVTSLGALTASWRPKVNTTLKFITSAFRTVESETFDIQGQYYISRLETDYGKDEFGEPVEPIGVGTFLNHARNYLDAIVFNMEHKGNIEKEHSSIAWGIKYQHESIIDELKEWQLLDSADYSLPHPPDSPGDSSIPTPLVLKESVFKEIDLPSNRISGYVQKTWLILTDDALYTLNAGIRANYWDFNQQLVVSPRITASMKPDWQRDFLFRLSAGLYDQPPFYREIRDPAGNINQDIKAQKSIQVVAGSDYNFRAWSRPFKLVTEAYYKYMDDLIPYVIDNVRIRYAAVNASHGYATGFDFRINGEFVRGVESWFTMSVMKTQEDIEGDYYYDENGTKVEPGYIPRPTDQRVSFSLFFQDYLPKNPTFKMHLNLVFGSSLPFGPPSTPKYDDIYRAPAYRRVDIGFSKQLKEESIRRHTGNFWNNFGNVWITLEIYNLLQVDNTVSYIWVSDINNRQYAIPNYLSPRMLNIKFVAQF